MVRQAARDLTDNSADNRNALVMAQARAAGLVGTTKDRRVSGRVSARLLEAARDRSGVTSDTELIELALSQLAIQDDFGARLVARSGAIPADNDLEF
jgi:hypothetical protein